MECNIYFDRTAELAPFVDIESNAPLLQLTSAGAITHVEHVPDAQWPISPSLGGVASPFSQTHRANSLPHRYSMTGKNTVPLGENHSYSLKDDVPPDQKCPPPQTDLPQPFSPPQNFLPPPEIIEHRRTRKPSQRVKDLIQGVGHTSARPSDPIVVRGVRFPNLPKIEEAPSLEATGTAEQMMLLIEEELLERDEELVGSRNGCSRGFGSPLAAGSQEEARLA